MTDLVRIDGPAPTEEPDLTCFEGVMPALVTRADARLVQGDINGAIEDLRIACERWPLDGWLARRLVDVLVAAGERRRASDALARLADSLAGIPAERDLRAQLEAEAAAVVTERPEVVATAWCWSPEIGDASLRALVALRWLGGIPAERLVIACPDRRALKGAVAVVTEALDERGIAADSLPDTELAIDAHDDAERWRRVANARLVVASPSSAVEGLARRMGRPVLMPCE